MGDAEDPREPREPRDPRNFDHGHLTPGACEQSALYGHSKYTFVRTVDRGTFGNVELAVDRTTGEFAAVKLIPRTADMSKYVQREIMNHKKLQHPHIVQLKEVFLVHNHLGIAMEFCAGRNLYNLVSNRGTGLDEADARWYFQQLIFATDYCHKMGVCNRDIKLENSLLAADDRPILKLCDFGYSKDEKYHSEAGSKVGTPAYLAPEVVCAGPGRGPYDGKKADIWSCGVALYVMLAAQYPFGRPEEGGMHTRLMQAMLTRIKTGDFDFPRCLQHPAMVGARDIIRRMLTVDPARRISIAEIMAHPWFLTDLPPGCLTMNDKIVASQREPAPHWVEAA